MFKWIKSFTKKILILVLLLEAIPVPTNNSFKKIEEAKAFATQTDSIAPGYFINMEGGNITFDLSSRLSETMTVESFKFRNVSNSSGDKQETQDEYLKDAKWISSDTLEHGSIYEIEADILDSSTGKTVKHINSFKYNDKNAMYRPRPQIQKIDIQGGRYQNQNIEIDFKPSLYLVNKCKNIEIEILNADFTPTLIEKRSITSEQLIKNNYLFTIEYGSYILEMNKDYVLRTSFDGKVWETLMSSKLKASKDIYTVFTPSILGSNNNIYYTDLTTTVNLSVHNAFKFNWNNSTKIKGVLAPTDGSLPEITRSGIPSSGFQMSYIPESYIGKTEPLDMKILLTDSTGNMILSETILQMTLTSGGTQKFWAGLDLGFSKLSDGYQVISATPISGGKIEVPYSWDGFPRAHYITMYDQTRTKQIGGEYRYDVVSSSSEFVGKNHKLQDCNFKVNYVDMKQGFNTFYMKVESSNRHKDWAYAYIPFLIYADIGELSSLQVDITNVSAANNGYNFSLKPVNFTLKSGEKMSIIDDSGTEHMSIASSDGTAKFTNIPLITGGKYVITYNKSSSMIHFNSLESSVLFNPVVVGTNIDTQEGLEVVLDKKFEDLLNFKNENNKIRILHLNGNPTGNELSNAVLGSNKFRLTNNLVNGETYIVELSNGNEVFRSTFEYAPLRLEVESASGTTVKLAWKYPNNYLIMDGDTLNIYFKKDGFDYPAVPTAKIMHGFQDINFDEVRTYTVKDLSPNINYTARLELITSDGVKYVSESDFVTSDFKILNETIIGLSENGTIDKKEIDVEWDINQADIEFSAEDRLDVFLKLKSHDVFPRTPEYTVSENLNRVRRVSLSIPTYDEDYSVRIVYVIGGVRHSSKIIDFRVELGQLKLTSSNVREYEATIGWEYPSDFNFENGQELRVFLKKSNEAAYPSDPIHKYIHSNDLNLEKLLSHKLTGLQEDTIYQAKIEYKIDEKTTAGSKEEVKKQASVEFKTPKLVIDNFLISRLSGKNIKLSWNMKNDYVYGDGDNVKIYVKERSQSSYPTNQVANIERENLKSQTSVEFPLPKYGTDCDIKITYSLNGKEVNFYTKYKLDIGNLTSKIESITDTTIYLSWEYPSGYEIQEGDILEIRYKEHDSQEWKKHFLEMHGNEIDLTIYKTTELNYLEKGKKYNLKIIFDPFEADPIENSYTFYLMSGFQISNINSSSVNSSSILLNWEVYYPKEFKFTQQDKIEIFAKEKSLLGNGEFSTEDLKFSKTAGLEELYSHKIENLKIGEEYVFRVKYTLFNNGENAKEIYVDVVGTPEFGQLESYIVDTGTTSVKMEVVYPENYEKLSGDILDIFIKKKEEQSYGVNANFSAVHGTGEDEFDLNEVTILEISGLAPSTDYDAKVVFWPDGGRGLKKEHEVSFKTNYIKGISELSIIEVMDYVVKIGIKIDSENLVLDSDDYCHVFVKKKGEENYPEVPNGESYGDAFNEDNSVFAYFDELNQEYEIKVVINIGGSDYEKTIDFVSKVDDLIAEVKEINPMTVQLEWKYPSNYTLVDGESIKIFIKYKDEENFSDIADFEMVQSPDINLMGTNLVELYQLIPDTEYEVKIRLGLLEVDLPEVIKEFKTTTFEVTDLVIKSITDEGVALSWKLSTEEIDFIDDFDNLAVFIKGSEDEEYDFSNPSAEFTKGLNDIRTALVQIDEGMEAADIMVSYLIEDYESHAEVKFGSLQVYVDRDEEGLFVGWEYPENIEFSDGDKISIYLKNKNDSSYDEDPIFECVHGKDDDLYEVMFLGLDDIENGEYTLKFVLMTQNSSYSPVEVEFKVNEFSGNSDSVKLEQKSVSSGRGLILASDYDLSIDYTKKIVTDPSGIKVEEFKNLNDEKVFMKLNNLVPGKPYEKISVNASLVDGQNVNLVIENVKIEAENLVQQFLTNIYNFAFERFPDEEGYTYWLDGLGAKEQVTGKYIVYNLMFAEREFTERNLPDREMIKVLYQIVVNREYDQEGLEYWVKEYNENYLVQANNDSFEAQKLIVMRMLYEQEFRNLCDKMDILW